jgi:hypothetical protein
MPMKLVPVVLIVSALAFVAYGQWLRNADPPRVISTGTFQFVDKAGATLIFAKRVVAVAGFETIQVQLPGGTWIDCRGDCAATIKAEYTEFWDHQQLNKR